MRRGLYREIAPGIYPALRLAFLLIAGIICARGLEIGLTGWLTLCCLALTTMAVSLWRTESGPFQICLYQVIVFAFGGFWFTYHNQNTEIPEYKLTVFEQNLTFHGNILEFRKTVGGHAQMDVQVDSVTVCNGEIWNIRFRTIARLFHGGNNPDLVAGNYIRFDGTLSEVSKPGNPNEFDYKYYLRNRNIHTLADIEHILISRPNLSLFSWLFWRVKVQSVISNIFSTGNAGLAQALLLGDRSGIDREQQSAFSRAGLAHLMAVSGMHVGFVLLPFWLIIPWFWTFRFGKFLGLAIALIILLVYSGVTGFSTSVIRASVMAILFIYGRLFQKPRESLNLLGVAALVILLINPKALFDIGFQLSFTAVLVILLVLPASKQMLPGNIRYGKVATVFQYVSISVFVQTGLYPILLHYFNEFSLIGPLSNTIAVPFVQFMFLLSIFCIPLEAVHSGLGNRLNTPSDFIAGKLLLYAENASALEWAWIEGSVSSPLLFIVWSTLFLSFASFFKPDIRWKMLGIFLFSLCLYQAHLFYQKFDTKLTVTVFDIGQGDAVLLETPDGKHVLYDTGILSPYQNSAERVLLPELKARGINKLDAVILSHPHADHIGGISTLIKNIPIEIIYDSGFEYQSDTFINYISDARNADIPIKTVGHGDMLVIGKAMRFFVTGPHPQLSGNDPNNWSLVIKAVYGNTSVLLTGDAGMQSENEMIRSYGSFLQSDLLKVGHHASHSSSGSRFLAEVQPTYSAVSLGLRNRYNHPHPEATLRLQQSGTKLLYTSLEGALVFTLDGEVLKHIEWRGEMVSN